MTLFSDSVQFNTTYCLPLWKAAQKPLFSDSFFCSLSV